MKTIREDREHLERDILSESACFSVRSKGRARPEPECNIRTCFQRDIDRIIHSKTFRRLKQKTQVFLHPEGDHYRTRLTHTFEVARIARTIARALRLNEDLTEAIALGHDLGHTPFGHAGERALNDVLADDGGFKHNEQSLRIVERLEKDGEGLNLTHEVRDGILCHSGETTPETMEGKIVRVADRVAYLNHDVDDAIRAGVLVETDIPKQVSNAFGSGHSGRINAMICDIILESKQCGEITFSLSSAEAFDIFRDFMFQKVYSDKRAKGEEAKVFGIISRIFDYYYNNPDKMTADYRKVAELDGIRKAVSDYVSGMTDKYAVSKYSDLFVPIGWKVR